MSEIGWLMGVVVVCSFMISVGLSTANDNLKLIIEVLEEIRDRDEDGEDY